MVCEPNQKPVTSIELKINGKEVELNSFAQNIISQTILGMVGSLRGVEDVRKISLEIMKSAE